MLSPVDPFFHFPFLFHFASCYSICHTLFSMLFLFSAWNQWTSVTVCIPKKQLLLFCLWVSIYPSPPLWGSLCLSLVSPLLWLVSVVSVRTVISAVTSLGENKVVLCSWHHKRHKRKEPEPKRKEGKREKLKELEWTRDKRGEEYSFLCKLWRIVICGL